MNITIIAYRENGEDYCMGSCMTRADSSLEIDYVQGEDTDTVTKEMADIIKQHLYEEDVNSDDDAFNNHEIVILVDGMEISNHSPYAALRANAMCLAQKQADLMSIEHKNLLIRMEEEKQAMIESKAKEKRKEKFEKLRRELYDE